MNEFDIKKVILKQIVNKFIVPEAAKQSLKDKTISFIKKDIVEDNMVFIKSLYAYFVSNVQGVDGSLHNIVEVDKIELTDKAQCVEMYMKGKTTDVLGKFKLDIVEHVTSPELSNIYFHVNIDYFNSETKEFEVSAIPTKYTMFGDVIEEDVISSLVEMGYLTENFVLTDDEKIKDVIRVFVISLLVEGYSLLKLVLDATQDD